MMDAPWPIFTTRGVIYVVLIMILLLGIGYVAGIYLHDPKSEHTTDKPYRDSLTFQAAVDSAIAQERLRLADSVAAFIAEKQANTPPAKTIYIQAHEEALTLPVAVKWHYMGRWPNDTVAP